MMYGSRPSHHPFFGSCCPLILFAAFLVRGSASVHIRARRLARDGRSVHRSFMATAVHRTRKRECEQDDRDGEELDVIPYGTAGNQHPPEQVAKNITHR